MGGAKAQAPAPGAIAWLLRTYPVTFSIVAPYAILIFPPAILNNNPSIGFILGVFLLAFGAAFGAESYLRFVVSRLGYGPKMSGHLTQKVFIARLGVFLLYFGLLASIQSARMGVGTIDSAVGLSSASSSPIATVLALVGDWYVIGTAFVVWGRVHHHFTTRKFALLICSAVFLKLVHVLILGITVQLWRYLVCVFFLLLYFQLMRMRTVLLAMLVVLIAWPMMFAVRNEIRELRGVAVATQVDAADRLRYDLQVGRAADIPPGLDLGQLDNPVQILRFGMIPRFLDKDRATVSTGRLINQYLGGSATSSYTFLPVATAYVLGNWHGLILLYVFWAVVIVVIMGHGRFQTQYRIMLMAMVLMQPLNWFNVHPDSAIGFVQDVVSSTPIVVFIAIARFEMKRRGKLPSERTARELPSYRLRGRLGRAHD